MTTTAKSLILLSFTLAVGFALGLFADATLVRGRRDRLRNVGRPLGFVEHLERVIQPRDSAQADSIRPILREMADGNEAIIRDANVRLRARLDSLRLALAPQLDAEQQARLARELTRMPAMGRGGPGGRGGRGRGMRGPGGGGPPHDGRQGVPLGGEARPF
jgi:hypothetical protein